jgi:tetratricopeptide (TPR) repeat protein
MSTIRPALMAVLGVLVLHTTSWADRRQRPSPPAAAESDPQAAARERARKLLAEGNQNLDDGRYLEALDRFQKAYEAFPSPKLHFNIAQTYNELGRPIEALRHYELFLRDVAQSEMPEQWALASERVFALQGRTATVVVQSNVVGATVTVDGAAIGATPIIEPVRLLPGSHSLIVAKPGFERQVIELTLAAGDTETARVTLLTTAEATAQRAEFQKAEAERRAAETRLRKAQADTLERRRRNRRILRTSGWTAIGVGVAASAAAGTFAVLQWREASEFDDAPAGWTWRDDARPHYDRAETYRGLFYGTTATAVVGLAVGTGLLLYSGGEPRAPERATLVPILGGDEAGVAVVGRF